MLTPSGPIAAAREAARALLAQALLELDPAGSPPPQIRVNFSPEGKGGDLASPYAQMAKLDPARLAGQVRPHRYFTRCYPNWGWIAFDLSETWWQEARAWQPDLTPLTLPPLPPVPDFPARITPESWRVNALLGRPRPELAARLDRGNPAVLLELVRHRCRQTGPERPDRVLAGLALTALEAQAPKPLLLTLTDLARRYLRAPGEEALVAKALDRGLAVLDNSGK